MTDHDAAQDIAFIRRTIQDGRAYARGRSADLLVWGLFVAGGYLATYAFIRHWIAVPPGASWAIAIVPPWLYSLRRVGFRLLGRAAALPVRSPMASALSMVWLACGLFMVVTAVAAEWGHGMDYGAYVGMTAGAIGIAFFAAATLSNLGWMRLVAFAWWACEIALLMLPHNGEQLLFAAAMMVLLLAGPGLVLLRGPRG